MSTDHLVDFQVKSSCSLTVAFLYSLNDQHSIYVCIIDGVICFSDFPLRIENPISGTVKNIATIH